MGGQTERFEEPTPMTEEQYEQFHARVSEEYGIDAKAKRAAENGGTLMVKSLVNPFESVPYEQFKEERDQLAHSNRTC